MDDCGNVEEADYTKLQKICIRKKQEGLHHEACSLRKTENMRKLVRLLCSFCSMERKDCATQLFHHLSTQIIRQITPFVRRKLNEKLRPYDISVSDTTPELFITDMQVGYELLWWICRLQ